ncbi:TPA: hypothetical protein ACTW9I_000719 [Raoultella planticola]
MSKQTGGPAFQVADGAAHRIAMQVAGDDEAKYIAESAKALSGMTLRDYFASKALGLCYADYLNYAAENGVQEGWRDGVAKDAYLMADAMLKAREGL